MVFLSGKITQEAIIKFSSGTSQFMSDKQQNQTQIKSGNFKVMQ